MRAPASAAIAIDTNLFSVLLCYHRLESEEASDPERKLQLQKVWAREDPLSLEQFDLLWQFFRSAGRRIVTQHVVAEVFTNRMRKRFNLTSAIKMLASYKVEERGCCIADLYASDGFRLIIETIGPTDAGLIHVAALEKATIVSEDGRLRHWAEVREVPTLAMNQLRYL